MQWTPPWFLRACCKQGKDFSFNLIINSSFSFSLDIRESEVNSTLGKKPKEECKTKRRVLFLLIFLCLCFGSSSRCFSQCNYCLKKLLLCLTHHLRKRLKVQEDFPLQSVEVSPTRRSYSHKNHLRSSLGKHITGFVQIGAAVQRRLRSIHKLKL